MSKQHAVDHPAKFSAPITELLTGLLKDAPGPVLDPFAGVGTIHHLGRDDTIGVEIEPEWATCHERTITGDSRHLLLTDNSVGTVCTSPAYGNRMADAYAGDAKGSKRRTYRISLDRELSEGNGAGMQWSGAYRRFHADVWGECDRVLQTGGLFILNVSDHIRGGKRQHVSDWHLYTLLGMGYSFEEGYTVKTRRHRFGQNHAARVDGEQVLVLRRREQ